MTPKDQFICLIANDALVRADAIIILEGDGLSRISQGARLYKEGWAPLVVISGGVKNPPHSITASEMLPHLIRAGVPEQAVEVEEKSQNTWEQGIVMMKIAKERGWQSVIIVASHYHQYRAFLTFLRAMQEGGQKIVISNAPARDLAWFAEDAQGRRIDLLAGEFDRIEKYRTQGNIASYEDAISYLEWKESQSYV